MSRNVVESMFQVIEWKTESLAYIECPGKSLHSAKNGKKDCMVHIDNAPTLFCLHGSCSAVVESANYKMRLAIWENNPLPKREFTEEEKLKIKKDIKVKKDENSLKLLAGKIKDELIKKQAWCAADAFHESPIMSDSPEEDSSLFISKMFKPDEVIWNGERVKDSGDEKYKDHFRTASEWLKVGATGNFTCGSVFKPGTFSRSNANVLYRPYLVVESDILNKDQICCIFKWLSKFMDLRAIVCTGGKSLHAWFKFPTLELYKKLETMLPVMDCDESLFIPSQPVRMPGVMRGDRRQCLYWLAI